MSGLVLPNTAASTPPPPIVAVNGLVPAIPASQLIAEEKRAAERVQNQPVITGLAAYVRRCFDMAQQAKRSQVEERLLRAIRQRRGEYDPEVMAEIRKQGGSEIYMMLTSNKCRAAGSWIKDVMFGTADQSPWTVAPTSEPSLNPQDTELVARQAANEAMQLEMQGMAPVQTPDQMRVIVQRVADRRIADMRRWADDKMKVMRSKMQDQLEEGRWYEEMDKFIDDLVTFPFAIMKGPVPRKRKTLEWVAGADGSFNPDIKETIRLEWERVDPFRAYWAPHATNPDDGYFVEHHRMSRADLNSLLGVEGYDEAAIRAVLDEYGRGGLNGWLMVNQAMQDQAAGKSVSAVQSDPEPLIDALQFWGQVQGKMLVEWGMDEAQVPDLLKDYDCEVWIIGRWVIKAILNADPYGCKPYYKTCYENIPGAFDGNGVSDLVRDTQRMCNAAARAMANNMGIGSGPQVVVYADRIAPGEDVTQLYPWRIWQMTSDPYGGTQKPVEFFMPDSHAQELMAIYEKFAVLADEYSGVPRYMTGDAPAQGAGRTASGMSMLMSNAGKAIKQVIGNIDHDVTGPLMERLYYYNMRYSDDPDLKGDVRVVARGVTVLIAKEQAQVRMNEILNIVSSNPMFLNIVGEEAIADLLREITKPLNINIVPPPEVIRARIAMQQQMQQMQMALLMQAEGQPDQVNFERDQNGQRKGMTVMPKNRQRLQNGAPVTDNFNPQRIARS